MVGLLHTAVSAEQDDYIYYNYTEQRKVFLKEGIIQLSHRLIYIRFCHHRVMTQLR